MIVKLSNNSTFLDEITEFIKIYKFLNKNASDARGSFYSIRRAKEIIGLNNAFSNPDKVRNDLSNALDILLGGVQLKYGNQEDFSA